MNELNSVYNKLFEKVDLASQKVELGLIQDIDNSINDANKNNQNVTNILLNIGKGLSDAKSECNLTLSKYNEALKKTNEALIKVKDLGLDVPEKQLQDKINNIKNYIKSVEDKIKNINSAINIL